MTKKVIYLGCPHCDWRQLLSTLTSIKKWNGWKEVHCQQCDTPSELSEWGWYEKHMVPFFREMPWSESRGFILEVKHPRTSGETANE